MRPTGGSGKRWKSVLSGRSHVAERIDDSVSVHVCVCARKKDIFFSELGGSIAVYRMVLLLFIG